MKHNRHSQRKDLAGEHKSGDMGQIICLVVFLIIWALDSFVFKYSTVLAQRIPLFIRLPVSIITLLISGNLARSGLKIIFGPIQKKPHVITQGVFNIVRHPIYLGSILFYLGLILLTFSILSVIMWILIIILYFKISQYEEKLLKNKFGKEYEKYQKKVPMLIPLHFPS